MNIMKQQIRDLFTNPEKAMEKGLWFSGYKDEGEYKEWYDNGKLYQHYWYKNNRFEGECKKWYKSGKLLLICSYKNNKRDGECKRWYENGQPEIHCWYKNGERVVDFIKHPELKKKYNIKY